MHDLEELAETSSPPCRRSRPLRGLPGEEQPLRGRVRPADSARHAKRLHGAGEDVAAAVQSYELEHKHRRGVIDATERERARG